MPSNTNATTHEHNVEVAINSYITSSIMLGRNQSLSNEELKALEYWRETWYRPSTGPTARNIIKRNMRRELDKDVYQGTTSSELVALMGNVFVIAVDEQKENSPPPEDKPTSRSHFVTERTQSPAPQVPEQQELDGEMFALDD
ncbi:hypothetical protein D9613_004363 [Agrocybe pediades]|uniref:Uncharacterized protein n=1 Tax=Agrocybe pediades TaxID=84607 RepID=A0A8H4QIV9_9AGAR|nr:hypothetical protein D9613_004363 [Agrocybe pediades]